MTQHPIIRRLTAGIMMLVFALSITPKLLLHHVFANHTDISYQLAGADSKKTQINRTGINCQCIDLVAESPFIDFNDPASIIVPTFFSEKKVNYTSGLYFISKFFAEFRGPPSLT